MERAKAFGYEIELVYIGTTSADINIVRVAARVSQGGHHIPEGDIRRRYSRSLANLSAALALVDRALLVDNSGHVPVAIISIEGNRRQQFEPLPSWALGLL
jgi:predicted ABC-type ATPase